MPARGVIVCEEMEMLRNNEMNTGGAIYSTSLIYGRGLYNAHAKSESLNFAGCVVDNSVFNDIPEEVNIAELMLPYGKLYSVPYKQQIEQEVDEYVLNIINGRLNEQAFQNYSESIRTRFSCDNKPVSSERVQELIRNSITFLTTFCE
ncbi:MAG: hypothetical protein BGO21_26170 [Dyadobacter sp. 50-39]|uniref:hypothetical protein n=1 Tax=Dyadobacter sp. 50-39 TaxID=1895756 RepID=UPI00095D8C0D|nr:hypothetical protein [Dyadobacter sp. 50-39]OJV22497.1 MAG: hypothetical protein BGO21_26170 [Dyadobacter sp. 50-39]